jgi:hypothetical protein
MRGFDPYSSTGFRVWRHKAEARMPFIRILTIPNFTYIGVGPLAFWRDGRRFGFGGR